jgi:hypothetical protein
LDCLQVARAKLIRAFHSAAVSSNFRRARNGILNFTCIQFDRRLSSGDFWPLAPYQYGLPFALAGG